MKQIQSQLRNRRQLPQSSQPPRAVGWERPLQGANEAGAEVPCQPREGPRGSSLIEMLAASTLFAALTLVMLPFLSRLGEVRQDIEDREYALRELRNALEERMGNGQEIRLDEERFDRLTEPQVSSRETEEEGGGTRVTVSLSWINSAGERVQPVELSCWRFPEESR